MSKPVKEFTKECNSSPTFEKWCSGFTNCKKYAINNNVPFIAVWISDEGCGNCIRFAESAMRNVFKNWMKSNDKAKHCIFWLGTKYSKGKEDADIDGAGYKWVQRAGG